MPVSPPVETARVAAPVALILFGSPGSGKGTQSKYIVEWLGIPQISTGDMLRDHIRRGTDIGRSIEARMKAGTLVPDELVNALVADRISSPDCSRGFILDGYPRTTAQAKEMTRLLQPLGVGGVVIHLAVDYTVIISRMQGRRVCPKCGTLYNLVSRPPQTEGICDLDGEALVIREDDRPEVVRERLEQYDAQTRPVIDYFRQTDHPVFNLDASRERPEMVFARIREMLSSVAFLSKEVVA